MRYGRSLRRLGLTAGALVGALLLAYVVLRVASGVLRDARDPVAFFDPTLHRGPASPTLTADAAPVPQDLNVDGNDESFTAPLVVAHQGGELLWPSNTMLAFTNAVELGADVLDTDMHRTSDGVLVLIHDETVDRTSEGTGAVRDLTFDQLATLDFAYRFSTDPVSESAGAEANPSYRYRGQGHGIVTVEDLFNAFGDGMRFGIEIKQTGPEAAEELCQLITDFGYQDRVLVSSFTQPNMDAFRQACPTVATSATEPEVRMFYVLHRLRLTGLLEPAYDVFQVPETFGGRLLLTQRFVDDAHAWGLPVIPWTIDDPETMDRLLELGVDGINTNRPDLLIDRVGP